MYQLPKFKAHVELMKARKAELKSAIDPRCDSDTRKAIEEWIDGRPASVVASKHDVNVDTLKNHIYYHLSKNVSTATDYLLGY